MFHQIGEQRQPISPCRSECFERTESLGPPRVARNELNPSAPRMHLDRTPRVARDGAIQRERAFVEKVQRPDVQRSSRQIDPRRSLRFDSQLYLFSAPRYSRVRSEKMGLRES